MKSEAVRTHGCMRALMAMLAVLVLAGLVAACGDEVERADQLEARGDLAGAVEVYRDRLKEDPDDLAVLRALAFDLLLLGRHDEALEVQQRIVALDVDDALTRVELAFNYLNHQGQPSRAVEYLLQATDLEPTAKNWTFLGQAQMEDNQGEAAENSLRESLAADPTYAHAYTVLSALLEKQGRSEDLGELHRFARENGVELSE